MNSSLREIRAAISPSMDLLAVASVFLENYFSALPVEEGGKLAGMIHRLDVLRGMAEVQRKLKAEHSRAEGAPGRPCSIKELLDVASSHSREQMAERFKET